MATHETLIPLDRLERAFPDLKPLYSDGDAVAEANRCLYCHDAPCTAACPTGIDVPTFIRKIATGNARGAARVILSANLLGYSCARVCPVEVLCVGACVYNDWHRPAIQIGRLQRYAVEKAFDDEQAGTLFRRAPATGRKVACVGAGPASLSLAGYLALAGVDVTLFERRAIPGGLNTTGVAPYKMHVDGALREVDFVRSLGITIQEGVEVGSEVRAADLARDYDAVFIGVGLGQDTSLGIAGEDGPGVYGATAWIERMKLEPGFAVLGVACGVVIGGGNTAIDAARELTRLSVPHVLMVYRRTAEEMPGFRHEMDAARREGVRLVEQAVPKEFIRQDGRLVGILLEDGRRIPADLAVVAIGQTRPRDLAAQFAGVEVDPGGRIVVDRATCRTGNPKIYAGGDAIRGGDLVVTAAQDGKRAARAICRALGVQIAVDAALNAGHQ